MIKMVYVNTAQLMEPELQQHGKAEWITQYVSIKPNFLRTTIMHGLWIRNL
ncbi:hypothetical protein D3C86_2026040 [compost metagenome]